MLAAILFSVWRECIKQKLNLLAVELNTNTIEGSGKRAAEVQAKQVFDWVIELRDICEERRDGMRFHRN